VHRDGRRGAIKAGIIAVPLSVPMVGSYDERVAAVLADTSPAKKGLVGEQDAKPEAPRCANDSDRERAGE
jgi:hypothetical protein